MAIQTGGQGNDDSDSRQLDFNRLLPFPCGLLGVGGENGGEKRNDSS